MIRPLDLPDPAGARRQRRMFRIPAPHVGADTRDPPIGHVCVHDTATAAIVAACAGDDRLATTRVGAGGFVDSPYPETGNRIWHLWVSGLVFACQAVLNAGM